MIKTTFIIGVMTSMALGLTFLLDSNNPEVCFMMRGSNLGKELKLKFEIIGDVSENVRFLLVDQFNGDVILESDSEAKKSQYKVSQKINYKHNYSLCWKSLDSEKREISFFYRQDKLVGYIDTDDVGYHRKLIEEYRKVLKDINENVKLQFALEDFYADSLSSKQFKMQLCYYLRGIILFFIVWIQVCLFLRLIDKKLLHIKDIVAGPI